MGSLASALTALSIEFCDHLTYLPGMAPRSANRAELENGDMQVSANHFSIDFVSLEMDLFQTG